MKENKFRSWDKYHKRYIEHKNINILLKNINNKNSQFEFEQYTGLKDKNGVDVFENDIIKHAIWGIIGHVYYDNGCYRCSNDERDLFLGHAQLNKCKVIGNIHETN